MAMIDAGQLYWVPVRVLEPSHGGQLGYSMPDSLSVSKSVAWDKLIAWHSAAFRQTAGQGRDCFRLPQSRQAAIAKLRRDGWRLQRAKVVLVDQLADVKDET